jgi:hypothetical protein
METGWLPNNPDRLAKDPDLRALQLRWLSDTLYMRRITFGASLAAIPANIAVLAFAPRAAIVTLPVSGIVGLTAAVGRAVRSRRGQP